MKIHRKFLLLGLALLAGMQFSRPALAFDDFLSCQTAVGETTRELLKTPVSTKQLHEIDKLISSALGKCLTNRQEAQTDLDEANALIKAANQ